MCEIKFATTPIQGNFFFLPQPLRIKRLSSGMERQLAGLSLLLSLFPEYSTLRPYPVKKASNIFQIYVDIFGRALMFNFSPHFPPKAVKLKSLFSFVMSNFESYSRNLRLLHGHKDFLLHFLNEALELKSFYFLS